jgi:hypothetical protein
MQNKIKQLTLTVNVNKLTLLVERDAKDSLTILKSLHSVKIEVYRKDLVNPLKGEHHSNSIACLALPQRKHITCQVSRSLNEWRSEQL